MEDILSDNPNCYNNIYRNITAFIITDRKYEHRRQHNLVNAQYIWTIDCINLQNAILFIIAFLK